MSDENKDRVPTTLVHLVPCKHLKKIWVLLPGEQVKHEAVEVYLELPHVPVSEEFYEIVRKTVGEFSESALCEAFKLTQLETIHKAMIETAELVD